MLLFYFFMIHSFQRTLCIYNGQLFLSIHTNSGNIFENKKFKETLNKKENMNRERRHIEMKLLSTLIS